MDFQSNNRSGDPQNNGEPYNENPLNNGNPYDNNPVSSGNSYDNTSAYSGNSYNDPANSGNPYNSKPTDNGSSYGNNPMNNGDPYGNNSYNNGNQYGPCNGNPYANGNRYGNNPYNGNQYNGNQYNSNPYNNPSRNGNPYYNGGPYGGAYAAVVTPQKGSGMATASMVLGIICLISLLLLRVYIPFLIGGVGIILAILSRGRARMSGRAKAGIICCITGLALDAALCVLSVYLLFALPNIMPEMMDEVDKICEEQYGMSYEEFMDQIYEIWDIEQ